MREKATGGYVSGVRFVEADFQRLRDALAHRRRAVLIAPPGAGKTTHVPPSLLGLPGRIVMLEPRRIAARAAARWMARQRGEEVGRTIGFRVRGETRVSSATRIEVVTEGVLLRMLQHDAALEGVSTVIFDEFHERSLVADLSLALLMSTAMVLRDDLDVLVMSATIDGAAVAHLLGDAPVIEVKGRAFPIEQRLAPPPPGMPIDSHVAGVVRDALDSQPGSILVFLPGAGAIRRVAGLLQGRLDRTTDLHMLHGSLSPAEQDAAVAPAIAGRRKVVLATNVAETSLTIDGITVVVDSGLERLPRYSPRSGMTRLETVRITRASADQRSGRAGRTAPGIAIRCWGTVEDAALVDKPRAELLDADLATVVLELAAHGFADPAELAWLDPPPAAAFAAGRELLQLLGAVDGSGRITGHGSEMIEVGAAPRLAHLMVQARAHGEATVSRAGAIVALLEERDILRGDGRAAPADLELRVDAVERNLDHAMLGGATLDRGALARIRARLPGGAPGGDLAGAASVGEIVAWGWPDRIARRRDVAGRFLMRNGRGVTVGRDDPLARAEWIVVPVVDDSGRDARVEMAAALDSETVAAIVAEAGEVRDEIVWDDDAGEVVTRRRELLGMIVLAEHPLRHPDGEAVREALLSGIRSRGIGALQWDGAAGRLRHRLSFLHHHDAAWPDVSDQALLDSVDQWLAPHLDGIRRLDRIGDTTLAAALIELIPWSLRRDLDSLAPERIEVPSGARIAVDYGDPAAPMLAVRLQEVFGWRETPRIMAGRVPLTLQLLSPARRPVQVTRDLASFWKNGYPEVRKELKGRYPKHRWPELTEI
ncbi:MAG TPA: ATP-dependent helicase HrpB [Gemmatimonadales bacterium]|nr:ATP-dependent helicase HrpB [Gemmatimonadales bacterium]